MGLHRSAIYLKTHKQEPNITCNANWKLKETNKTINPQASGHSYFNDKTFGLCTSMVGGCHHAITKCLICWSSGEYTVWSWPRFETDSESLSYSNPWARPCGKRGKRWATKSYLDLPFPPHLQEPNDLMRSPLPLMNANLYGKEQAHPFHWAPPFVFGTTWYWGDGKSWRGWAQWDSGFIASRHSPSASSYIWLVEYSGGPDLFRLYRFLCQERTILALFLLPPVLHSGQCAPLTDAIWFW